MFHGHLDHFQKPPLGSRPTTKPRDHGTPNAHKPSSYSTLSCVRLPAWIEIHRNSIWLRARTHVAAHYITWGPMSLEASLGAVITMSWGACRLLAGVWSGEVALLLTRWCREEGPKERQGGTRGQGSGDRGGRLQNPMLLCLERKRYSPKSRPCQPCTCACCNKPPPLAQPRQATTITKPGLAYKLLPLPSLSYPIYISLSFSLSLSPSPCLSLPPSLPT